MCLMILMNCVDPATGEINGETLGTWMEDLEASSEGVMMYFLLYKCGASSTMTITNSEFLKTMTEWKFVLRTLKSNVH